MKKTVTQPNWNNISVTKSLKNYCHFHWKKISKIIFNINQLLAINFRYWKNNQLNNFQLQKSVFLIEIMKLYVLRILVLCKMGFQIDASKIAISANQIQAEKLSTNQRASSEHHFENQWKALFSMLHSLCSIDYTVYIIGNGSKS